MIKFITEENNRKRLTFGDVKNNQFFVDYEGDLCQKINEGRYHVLADERGYPRAISYTEIPTRGIRRILPHVTKIEF